VRTGNLAPDHPDVGAADLTLGTVNESDLLANVEAGGLRSSTPSIFTREGSGNLEKITFSKLISTLLDEGSVRLSERKQ
jgi:hypothetical protein